MTSTETATPPAEPLFDPNNVATNLNIRLPLDFPGLEGLIRGGNPSDRLGQGQDKDGLHEYQAGDPSRSIDWRATARNPEHKLLARYRHKDTDPSIHVIADLREAINPGISEQLLIASVSQIFIRIAESYGLPSSLTAINDEGVYFQPQLKQGRQHLVRTSLDIAELIKPKTQPDGLSQPLPRKLAEGIIERPQFALQRDKVTLASGIRKAARMVTGSLTVPVAGFHRDSLRPDDKDKGYLDPLKELIAAGNDILAVEIFNQLYDELTDDDSFIVDGVAYEIDEDDEEGKEARGAYIQIGEERNPLISATLESIAVARLSMSADQLLWLSSLTNQLRTVHAQHRVTYR